MPFHGTPKTESEKHLERSKQLREYIKGVDSRRFNLDDCERCIAHYGWRLFQDQQPDSSFGAVGKWLGIGPNHWMFTGTSGRDEWDHKEIADKRLADHIRSLELKVYAENEQRMALVTA